MLLELHRVSLNYGDFHALKAVDLRLGASEVHAVVGEHGAGKSSLGLILSGVAKPQSGALVFAGKRYGALTPKISTTLGIEMVHQQTSSLNKYFTIADNFTLDSAPMYAFWNKKKTLRAAQAFLDRYDIPLNPSTQVKALNLNQQIFVDILKHLYARPKLLILDEALEKLSAADFKKIVTILMEQKQAGTSTLLITHRIDDIYDLADRVSVMKHGEILLTDEVRNIDKINLIKMAYTQISDKESGDALNQEFYQLLKYNEAILRNLPVNLIITDNENRIKMVNDHCKRSFHLETASYQNVPLHDLLVSENQDVLKLLRQGFGAHAETTLYQVPISFHDVPIVAGMRTLPIYDGTFPIGNILIIEDVSEYAHLQKQVMLSEKLASVGLLAAGVAHEINNPLEIISNSLTYLKYRIRDDDLRDAIGDIHEEMTSISHIVSNLHTFSDNARHITEDLGINDLIQDMLKLIRYNAKYKHIRIHFEPCGTDPNICANKNEIKQVILNLLKNSFEAMPSGGDIFIHAAAIIDQTNTPQTKITFEDTGPGICDADVTNVFLPFYSTKKEQEQNLGLGLSVSYGIITKYHGTMTVENVESGGCRFIITLPRCV